MLLLPRKIEKREMSKYPIVILSARYRAVEHLIPQLPEKPKEPELNLIKKNWFERMILWCDEYDDMQINAQRKLRYEQQMIQYKQNLAAYERKVRDVLSDTSLSIFREIERKKRLYPSSRGDELKREVQKGRHEVFFVKKLKDAFGDKITDKIEFTLPNGNAFVPDATYIDSSTGLCIDIEVDEPYTIPEGVPIHYIGGPDEYRNSFFSDKGWFVIRFAEEQIAKHSNECISFIKNFISNLMIGRIPSFDYPVDQWTKGDAYLMSECNYRQSY